MNDLNRVPLAPITELLSFIVDNRGKVCPTVENGFPLIATNCIKHSSIYPTFENIRYVSKDTLDNWFRAELKPNDILFVNKGTPGRVCLVPNPVSFCVAQDTIGLRVNEKVYYKYLFAVLRSDYIQNIITNYHVGIAIPHFKKSDLSSLLIPLPEMQLQKKIGDLYCGLSEIIENNNKIISELESLAKTIYDYWFLQFEFPNEDGKPYKSSGGKMVWNDELKREIPEGWKVTKLDKCVETIIDRRGVTPKKLGGDWVDEGIIALSAKVVKNGRLLDLSTANKVSEEMYDKWMPTKLANGDILMTSEAPLGEFYYLYDEPKYCLSQRLFAIRAKKHLSSLYLYYELSKGNGFSQIKGSSSGSTVFGIRQDELRQIKILVPNEKVMQSFQSNAIKFISLQHSLDRQNRELASLRDFLLPMLMNGQVTFKEDE